MARAPRFPQRRPPAAELARRRSIQAIVALIAAVTIVLSVQALLTARRVLAAVDRAQALATRAATNPTTIDLDEAVAAATEAHAALASAQRVVLPWRLPLHVAAAAHLVPREYGQVGPLLDFAAPASGAGEALARATQVVTRRVATAGASDAPGPLLAAALDEAAPHLADARALLAQADAARPAVRLDSLAGRLAPARPVVAAYDTAARYPATRALLLDAPAAWHWIAGVDGARTYHVLGQNVDELRATGGFLASAGEITVQGGQVTQVAVSTAAGVSRQDQPPVEPPRPLREYMGLGSWILQDANWWADFPSTAAQAAAFWRPGPPPDGTIAADDDAIARLVAAAGPLTVPGVSQPVTGENLASVIATNVYAGATSYDEAFAIDARKTQFLGSLFGQLMAAAVNPPPAKRGALVAALLTALRNKELLVALNDPRWAAALRELGWDGHLDQQPGDLLYLVETTVSNTKLARQMRTNLSAAVMLDDAGEVRRTSVTLRVENTFSPRAVPSMYPSFYYGQWWNPRTLREEYPLGRYAGYYRFYVPRGTHLVDASGWDFPLDFGLDESGRAVVGGYLMIDPAQAKEARLELAPPPEAGAADGIYRLAIPRQPGAAPRQLSLSVAAAAGVQIAPVVADGPALPVTRDGAGQARAAWSGASDSDVALVVAVSPFGGGSRR